MSICCPPRERTAATGMMANKRGDMLLASASRGSHKTPLPKCKSWPYFQ